MSTKFYVCGFFACTGIPGGQTSSVPRYAGYAGYDGDSAGHDIDSVSSAKSTAYYFATSNQLFTQ